MLRSSFRGIDPVTPGIFEGAERDARDGVEADAGEPFGGEEDAAEADGAGDAEDAGGGPLGWLLADSNPKSKLIADLRRKLANNGHHDVRFIPGEQNFGADCCSKGCDIDKLCDPDNKYISGPDFLSKVFDEWPTLRDCPHISLSERVRSD